jgi:hypothetical protein
MRVETRSVAAGADVADAIELAGMTIAAGLAVEEVSA